MSTYYNFYLAYRAKDGKIYPIGPFDKFGNYNYVYSRSKSFCWINNEFTKTLNYEEFSDGLINAFVKKGWDLENPEERKCFRLGYMYLEEMPSTNFYKSGYYKYEEVINFFNDDLDPDYFSIVLSTNEYALMLKRAVDNDNKEEIQNLKEFTYLCFPDKQSKEYDSCQIQTLLEHSGPYDELEYSIKSAIKDKIIPKDQDIDKVVILMETC